MKASSVDEGRPVLPHPQGRNGTGHHISDQRRRAEADVAESAHEACPLF